MFTFDAKLELDIFFFDDGYLDPALLPLLTIFFLLRLEEPCRDWENGLWNIFNYYLPELRFDDALERFTTDIGLLVAFY